MSTKTVNKFKPARKRRPHRQSDYLLRESDVERIDSLISMLGLAIRQMMACREIRDRSCDEMPALEDFETQVELVLQEADLQLQFPWSYASDF